MQLPQLELSRTMTQNKGESYSVIDWWGEGSTKCKMEKRKSTKKECQLMQSCITALATTLREVGKRYSLLLCLGWCI